jgi:hypothetical protein
MNIPHHSGISGPRKSKNTRTIPYTPVLIITPDMSAETFDGAAGCASGSQMCRGMMPALMPKPTVAQRKTSDCVVAGRWDPMSLNEAKLNEPENV